jgi:prolyl-tRNA editing enzyme YbaK/EbsC (Cys-tRNA(Pro) deacylase)
MPLVAPAAEWDGLFKRLRGAVPEAFDSASRALNLMDGEWKNPGFGRHYTSAIDGRSLGRIPMLDLDSALAAVKFARSEANTWARVDLDERRRRVSDCLAGLKQHRELIALLLMWEIGKPYAQALTDIDRSISGVEWYVENIAGMLAGRAPLGLISNIASWNYPMSVLMHAVLVQVLAGNSSISKTPTILSSRLPQAPRAKNSSATFPTTLNSPKKLRPKLSLPSANLLFPRRSLRVYNLLNDLGERSTPMSVPSRLKSFLDANRVPYESLSHSTTYTAQGTATVMQISGREMAKTVVLRAGEQGRETILAVLPGPKHVDLDKLAQVLGKPVRLATELEFCELFPDCELGAMPPFGALYDLPVYVDESLARDQEVVFNAGTHRDAVRMTYEDFVRLAKPKMCAFV